MRLTIIVGFPRSGTSLISHILGDDVFYSGEPDQIRQNPDIAPNGLWESDLIASVNENLFRSFGIDGLEPDGIKKIMAIDWQNKDIRIKVERYTAQAQLVINSLIRQMKEVDGKHHIYWKDPRTSVLLRFWIKAIHDGNRARLFDENIDDVNIVWCFRNPEETSDSMVDIDENNTYERDQYLAAWDLYNSYLANAIADLKLPFYLVNYGDILKSPKKILKGLFSFLGEKDESGRIDKAVSKINPELQQFKSKKRTLPNLYVRLLDICSKQIA